ncbi:transcription initiation factor TFIID subunit 11-like [Armigeres subalbatus]|uniref:transcription initiation factor TFIID subunit 11-like n=1 Tax=Armigeres subalbatus TaxID=124917 RepID=UPI002ED65D06
MVKAGSFTLTPCGVCSEASETNEGMVGCDACELWFHFRCVAVSEELLEDVDKWFCPSESCQKVAEETRKKTNASKKAVKSKGTKSRTQDESESSVKSDHQSAPSLEKQLKALEREQKAKEQEMEIEKILREKRIEMDRILKEKQLKINNELREKELQLEKEMLDKALHEEQVHADRMQQMRESYQNAIENMKTMTVKSKTVVVQSKLEKAEVAGRFPAAEEGCSYKLQKALSTPLRNPGVSLRALSEKQRKQLQVSELSSDEDHDSVDDSDDEESDENINNSEPSSGEEPNEESENESEESSLTKRELRRRKKAMSHGLGRRIAGPTKAQLAARNGISRKLPIFSGKPEEWPLFIGSYEASNEACGFNDVENLVRLQDSLKGSALDSVRGQLLLPKSVPKVINKLRQLYGRPEQLLHFHLGKVKQLDPPKADRLETFIPFGNVVEELWVERAFDPSAPHPRFGGQVAGR